MASFRGVQAMPGPCKSNGIFSSQPSTNKVAPDLAAKLPDPVSVSVGDAASASIRQPLLDSDRQCQRFWHSESLTFRLNPPPPYMHDLTQWYQIR
jgi:hypothetical protein